MKLESIVRCVPRLPDEKLTKPSPASKTVCSIKRQDASSEESAEGVAKLRSREEDGGSKGKLLLRVPAREQEDSSREEGGLCRDTWR